MTERQAPAVVRRLVSLAFAILCTMAILAGVDRLAAVEPAAPQLVQSTAGAHA